MACRTLADPRGPAPPPRRAHEAALKAFPRFTTTIDGQNVHFPHVRSPGPDALPLILTHGRPSTVHDFAGIIGPLTDPRAHGGDAADAFHVVAPSLPGFAHSGPTTAPGWGTRRIATAWAELTHRLGYHRYGAQGGDFGAIVSPELGRVAPERVVGVHLNAPPNASAPLDAAESALLSADERARAEANARWWRAHSGYATQMSTRPRTVACALNDSPVGRLAWTLEWFVDHDPTATRQTPPSWDAVLTDVTAFRLTGTAGSAARLYREIPTGVALFLGDRAIRTLAELSDTVTRWTVYDAGGHFASLQAPRPLVADVRAFFRSLR
ncbi:epoxide hydrolase [Kitasatospora putterlickiae]|uniref:Epoxide hydrolase n=1 Tax=Kitasatospora putterlickiae TaxID=221725 RepID=A0ABP4IER4_9ACTN